MHRVSYLEYGSTLVSFRYIHSFFIIQIHPVNILDAMGPDHNRSTDIGSSPKILTSMLDWVTLGTTAYEKWDESCSSAPTAAAVRHETC